MNPTTNYDAIIISTGPSSIFCAYELTQERPGIKILMMEKGHPIEKRACPKRTTRVCVNCKPCFTTMGFAGTSVFSDGKLSLSPDVEDNFPEILGYDETVELLRESDNIYLELSADANVHGMDKQKEIEEIRRKAIGANLKLTECPIRYLGTEEGCRIYIWLQEHLLTQGIIMESNTMVRDIVIEGDTVRGIIIGKDETYYASEVVSVIGREGSDWFSYICGNHGIRARVGTVDVGARVEVRDGVMKFLNKNSYEARLVYYASTFGDKARTFCTSPSGEMATEYYENSLAAVNGHAYRSREHKTDNTNFALLVSRSFTKPSNEPIKYGKHIAQLSNMFCGGRITAQTLGNFQRGRRAAEEHLHCNSLIPTLKDAVPSGLSLVFPYRIMADIKEMLLALNKVIPGIASDGTLPYGVEVKFYSSKAVVNADFETSIRGLRAIGDGTPITRGLQQAPVNGISVARSILKQIETL